MLLRSCVENEGGWRTEVKGSKVTKYLQRRKESKERKRIKKEKEEKQYINRSALTPEKVMQIVPVNDTFRVVRPPMFFVVLHVVVLYCVGVGRVYVFSRF